MARNLALENFQKKIAKTYGDRVAERPEGPPDVCPTGSLTLDRALREGGWRRGKMHEIVGPPDVGKSTLVICSMREHQKRYPKLAAAYVDVEGTFDYDWAEANGLDTSKQRWEHVYANSSEDASDQARDFLRSGLFSVVTVDSIGGMESKKAYDKDADEYVVGRNAQVITRMVKHSGTLARQTSTTVLLVNQYRANVGSLHGGDIPAGPKAQQHATTTRVRMSRGKDSLQLIMEEGADPEVVAVQAKAKVERSKLHPPGRTAEFWINNRPTDEYGPPGINIADEYVTLGLNRGVIEKSESWYTAPGAKQVQGKLALMAQLQADEKLLAKIREMVLDEAR